VSNTDDALVASLSAVVAALLEGRHGDANTLVATLRHASDGRLSRPVLPTTTIARVFVRDNFTCRYCGVRTVPPVVLRVLSVLYTDELPYDPHWKTAHPMYWKISSSVDHLEAGSSGGDWTDSDNLVTACYQCNQTKSNVSIEHLGWTADQSGVAGWDGLTGFYPALWELAGRPRPAVHRPWLRAFAAVSGETGAAP